MIRRRKAVNYLSNKNLLEEIHKSKCTYCEFSDPKYMYYDLVLLEGKKITKTAIKQAKVNKAKKINEAKMLELSDQGMNNKEIEAWIKKNGVKADKIKNNQIVIRIMTNDHVPIVLDKKGVEIKAKVNFPPFQHFAFVKGAFRCVGKSHTKDGKFSVTHGHINRALAKAFMMLVDKYGNKGNWRGYTWLEEMKGAALVRLSQIGLQFDENKSSNPFAWYTTVITRSFTAVLNTEKDMMRGQSKIMQEHGMAPSYSEQAEQDLENHRIYTELRAQKPTDTYEESDSFDPVTEE